MLKPIAASYQVQKVARKLQRQLATAAYVYIKVQTNSNQQLKKKLNVKIYIV